MSPRDSAALFDLDGTLIDLAVAIDEVRGELAEMMAPMGYRGGFSPILQCIEQAARAVVDRECEVRAWVLRCRAVLDRAECAAPMSPRPGAGDVLRAIAERGSRLGLFTDNGGPCAARALAALGVRPDVVVTRDDVARSKPDPEGLCLAAERLLPRGGELWVVGDSERDMQAAARARQPLGARPGGAIAIHAIGVTGGRSSADVLRAAGAVEVVDDLAEVNRRMIR